MARGIFVAGLAGLFAADAVRIKSKSRVAAIQQAAEKAGVQFLNAGILSETYTLTFTPETTDAEIQSACNGHCQMMGHPSEGGLAFAVMDVQSLTELLDHTPSGLEMIQPDVQDMRYPDIPEEGVSTAAASWGLDAVGVSERPATGRGVHVYVADTGIRTTHMDFEGRASAALDFTSGEMIDCRSTGDSNCARDRDGHGTHCAGTVGGRTYGVASGVNLHAIQTLTDTGSGQRWWQIYAIEWVTINGQRPAVLSMSLGAAGSDPNYNRVIKAATEQGVVVVVAAGNFGDNTCSYVPASVPEAITVGAIDSGNSRAHYSNFGTCNDLFAPGSSIVSASHQMDYMDAKKTGTSMACPHVSGGAAILLGLFPGFKADDVLTRMKDFGRKGFVQNAKAGDPDLSLWVGKNKAPGKPMCPSFATTSEPNYWGDCACKSGFCSVDGSRPNCPTSAGVGGWGGNHFDWECSECKCY